MKADTFLFPKGKTKFIRPDGSIGRAPGHGVVLLSMGSAANEALRSSGLGWFINRAVAAKEDVEPWLGE